MGVLGCLLLSYRTDTSEIWWKEDKSTVIPVSKWQTTKTNDLPEEE